MAMEVICLVVMAQQVSAGRVVGVGVREGVGGSEQASQNISPSKKGKQHRRLSPRNVHHTRSLHSPHTSQQTRVYPPSAPAFFALPLFALSFREGWLPLQKKMLKGEGEGGGRKNNRGHHRCTARCLFSFHMSQG